MRELSQQEKLTIQRAANSNVPYIEGIIMDRFNLMEIASAIEREVAAMGDAPNRKITIHMDAIDAVEMAKSFRKLALLR